MSLIELASESERDATAPAANRSRLRLAIAIASGGELRVEEWRGRLPEGVSLDVLMPRSAAHHQQGRHEIELVANAAEFDLRSLYLLLGAAAGRSLPAAPSYDAYRQWRQRLLNDPEWAEERARWREQERADDPPPRLPEERSADGPPRSETVACFVPDALAAAVRACSESRGWEPATLWLAAWGLVLSRRTSSRVLPIALGIDGRNYEPLAAAIGPYARWVPLNIRVNEAEPVERLVDLISADYRQSWQTHEHYDDGADVDGETRRRCERPFGFEYRHWPAAERVADIQYDVIESSRPAAVGSKARLLIEQTPRGTRAEIEFDARMHTPQAMRWLLESCLRVVDQAVACPSLRLDAIDHRSDAERDRWRSTNQSHQRVVPPAPTLHEWIEHVSAVRAGHVAVSAHGGTLTYGELNARANRLARFLIAQTSLAGEARVGLCLPRGPELVTAMLAVWKAGAAYVPLDDEWPAARVTQLLSRTDAVAVIANNGTAPALAGCGVPVIDLDRDVASIEACDADDPGLAITGERLAYVLFTSGSTGEPKGVAVEHRQLAHYTQALLDRLRLDLPYTFASLTTPAADLGNTAIFGALCGGGRLEWIDRRTAADPLALDAYCQSVRIDAAKMTPSHVRALLSGVSERPAWLPAHTLVLGGEALAADLLAHIRMLAPDLRIMNHYGPTETTVGVLTDDVTLAPAASLGRPLGESQTWVCHAGGAIAGIAEAGELWIGGPCVSRGYWRDAALTADRFRPDPYRGVSGARLYRTGDLARLREDGAIEYLGRIDEQVKIRGYRVEPEEVAVAVRALPGIRQAAVIARRDEIDADSRLVAYVVASGETSETDWRVTLERALPTHLLPSQWVRLERLPLMPNGKLDRAALPKPISSDEVELPADALTPAEEIVAAIWTQVLKTPVTRRDDDFFHLGGHSLLATRVVARLRAAFGVAIALRRLFEDSTVGALAASIDRLLRSQTAGAMQSAPPLVHSVESTAPLSFAQQRLWFLEQLEPGRAVYHVPLAVRLRGRLDREALDSALNEIVRRHDALRTVFIETADGEPRQQVTPPAAVTLTTIDLSRRGLKVATPATLDEEECRREVERLATAAAREPFDLRRGPLWRATLLRLAADEHVILLTLHHIICDGWSMAILVRELGLLYDAARHERQNLLPLRQADARSEAAPRRQVSPLPALSLQYADYARWQRAWLQGDALDAQIQYWCTQLAGAPPELSLPTDRPRPAMQSFRGGRIARVWPAALANDLRAVSRQEGVTLFMTLLAGFQVLLARYSGTTDICVGSPIANRTRMEVEGLVGFFVNTLVLRTNLSGDPSFRALLRRVRQVALGAYAHQDLPFERIVDELQPERALTRNPLFQVMFVFQNGRERPLQLSGLTLTPVVPESTTSKFDLTLTITPQPDSFAVSMEYSADLFDASTIERLLDHLATLLGAAAAAPDSRISELRLLGDTAIGALLAQSNGSAVPAADLVVAHQRISAWAKEQPDIEAIAAGADRLTFPQLDRRANQLAHYLRQRGVADEDRVALCVSRNPGMVIALLAILKAGAAYVPLDPAYPIDRLQYITDNARAGLILTDNSTAAVCAALRSTQCCLDARPHEIARCPDVDPAVPIDPQQLAYILYTSGSTGRPKGVMVTHEGLANYLEWSARAYDVRAGSGAPVHSPLTFDLTITSLLTPLAAGRGITLLPDERDLDSLQTVRDASVIKITPAHLQVLAAAMPPEAVSGWTRMLVVGGEALNGNALRFFRTHAPRIRIVNEYGPTETVVGCCVHELPPGATLPNDVPIGRPIANTVLRVLDSALQLVPPGVPGELFIGGIGVARGYVGSPDLTAERFVPDPFSTVPGARLYRTGDIVRIRDDGNLHYEGRADHQIKLRGYRIELGEIEAALGDHPAVRQCAVRVRGAGAEAVLCAYVVLADRREGDTDASDILTRFLRARLPAYMVPAHFVFVAQLPLTSNGKVDTRALLALRIETSEPGHGTTATRPFSETEAALAAIWEDMLGTAPAPESEFFTSGGHSLLAVTLLARVRQQFQVELPLRSIFEDSTLARFAARIDLARRPLDELSTPIAFDEALASAAFHTPSHADDAGNSVVLLGDGREPPLFLVHPISGSVNCYRALATDSEGPRLCGIQSPALFGYGQPLETVEEMATQYVADLRGRSGGAPVCLAGWSSGGLIAYEMARQMARAGQNVRALILIDTRAPVPRASDSDDALLTHLSGGVWRSTGAESLDDKLAGLLRILQDRGIAPTHFSLDWLRRAFLVYRANHRARSAYAGGPYAGVVHLIGASESMLRDPVDGGWRDLVTGPFQTHVVPGAHHTLFNRNTIGPLRDRLFEIVRSSRDLA